MSENISAPAAVDNPLNAKELILSYIARLLNNENPAEPKNVSRADEVNIYIAKLIAAGSGGGDTPEIPAPTAEDNGRFLGVDSGAYALLAAPPTKFGGKEVFWVTLQENPLTHALSADKTYAEIQTASYDPNKIIYALFPDMVIGGIAPMRAYTAFPSMVSSYRASFQSFGDNNTMILHAFDVFDDNSVTDTESTYDLTPHT